MGTFELPGLIELMKRNHDLWEMGHGQDQSNADLGLGWLYYGLTRTLQPSLAVVIGSWRGFVPMLIGQAIQDTNKGGGLIFIDPSFVDQQWAADVEAYFSNYGINCIQHYKQTSQELLKTNELSFGSIDLLFIDGYHTYDQCRLEYEGFMPLLSSRAITLFHDSCSRATSTIYGPGKEYEHTVWQYIDELKKDPNLEVLNVDIAQGIAIVRRSD